MPLAYPEISWFCQGFDLVDMERMPYMAGLSQLDLKERLYNEGRRVASRVTLIAVDDLNGNGFGKVIIADSHRPKVKHNL